MAEHQPRLGLADRHPLATAQEERHTRPPPAVDPQLHGDVRLGVRSGLDAVDRLVAVVLTAHAVLGIGVADRLEHRLLGVLLIVGLGVGGCLHRDRGHDLHQVVDDHVAQRADRVIEMPAV